MVEGLGKQCVNAGGKYTPYVILRAGNKIKSHFRIVWGNPGVW